MGRNPVLHFAMSLLIYQLFLMLPTSLQSIILQGHYTVKVMPKKVRAGTQSWKLISHLLTTLETLGNPVAVRGFYFQKHFGSRAQLSVNFMITGMEIKQSAQTLALIKFA